MSDTVLVIGYVWPEPNSSAAGSHMLSLLRMFRDYGRQVVFASPAQRSDYMADLQAEGIETADILLNDSSFDKFVLSLQPDYVVYDRFMMEEQFSWRVEQACPEAMHILDTEDLQCLRHARQVAHREKRKCSRRDLHNDIAYRECAAILRCDLSLIISEYEMQLLQDSFNIDNALLHYLPFMLDPENITPSDISFNERRDFVTIGNFRHAPNWDSVLYLQQIWPLIRQQLPEARLHIYGSYPPKKAMTLNDPNSGFLVKGWATSANEALEQARVCLAPLRFGAGIKGKLVDAMLAGTPSVTTAIGAEGMCGDHPWPGIITDDAKDIAKAAVSLYSDEHLWQQSQHAIDAILKDRYQGSSLAKAVMSHIGLIKQNLPQHRLNNFTGSMLRHHSMKSTLYMSKWIETKNKKP
jgi:glycosyltransferase involved in cell wall biosynthesis